MIIFKDFFAYLIGSDMKRKGERKREKEEKRSGGEERISFHLWFTPQMTAMAGSRPMLMHGAQNSLSLPHMGVAST